MASRAAWTWVVALALAAGGCASLPRPPWSAGPTDAELAQQREQKRAMQKAIRAHLGVRYRLGGNSRKGMDCSAFTSVVLKAAGVELPRTAHDQYREGRSVTSETLQFGDLLFFNTRKFATSPMARCHVRFCPRIEAPWIYGVTHTGVYVGEGRFVHASTSHGVSYARMDEPYWEDRYIGARRLLPDWHEEEVPEPLPAPGKGGGKKGAGKAGGKGGKGKPPARKSEPPPPPPPSAAPAAQDAPDPDEEPPPATPPAEMEDPAVVAPATPK